ncbi:MAG: GntR family transcriptional regulator [Muribaculaceae bacterium]|nr:GntR family transcriptional regulator [Muribaculaceae bacterium]MBQ6647800.1 GntR family transcriptional regulator [Muribaculaceae bacterium]
MKIGQYNKLMINRFVDFGAYLIDDEDNEVLLPKRYLTGDEELDDWIEVFVYNDSENRPVATTEHPHATVGEFCLMRVKAVNAIGAFLDWGLVAKDLLVPFREQRVRMQAGRSYIVYVYLDENSGRIVASAKLDKFLGDSLPDYYHRQKVDALIVQQQEIGYRVIIDGKHWGMIYNNEIYNPVNIGEHHMAFVKQVRDDGKIDVTLAKIEKMRVDDVASEILKYLKHNGGSMTLNDKSAPDDIMRTFNCSKKDFKKALGQLYKQHRITLGDTVKLTGNNHQ